MDSDADTLSGGLPHSEIPGSTIARISPGLFAACHVLHRLSVPRHPPDALNSRLSATSNGKDHPDIKHSDIRTQNRSVRQTLLLRRHFVRETHARPLRTSLRARARFPATVTQLTSSPCAINNIAPRHPLKDKPKANSASCRVSRDRRSEFRY